MNKKRIVLFILIILMIVVAAVGVVAYFFGGSVADVGNVIKKHTSNEPEPEPEPTIGAIYYFEADRLDRYEAYREKHPDMSDEDIVWRVNVNLDRKFYKKTRKAKDPDSVTVLINKYNKVKEDFTPEDLVKLDISGVYVTREVGKKFNEMRAAAAEDGEDFFGQSGLRSVSYQRDLYNRYLNEDAKKEVDTYSARPGFSEHHTGLAIDLNVGNTMSDLRTFEGSTQAKWIDENAADYGFIVRYTEENKEITGYIYEPWHIRYIGVEHAQKMKEENISSYEEYWTKYIDHTPPEEDSATSEEDTEADEGDS